MRYSCPSECLNEGISGLDEEKEEEEEEEEEEERLGREEYR